ncbi:DUF3486 family protein [Burkholderia sp. LMG 21824]|uniref:DUF3486 family protein n=1 Tax=Burkholderia sp. LMG 21824 TaxID=3158172 RepID=UPI003C2CA46E
MPPRSKIETLPKPVKEWLDKYLVDSNFADYNDSLIALNKQLESYGIKVSASGLKRYGKTFAERLKSLHVITEQARAVVTASPDDDGAVNDALVRLTQEKLFSVAVEMDVNPESIDLAKFARAVAELGKASVMQKRWQAEARRQAFVEAAKQAQTVGKGLGLTDEFVAEITSKILGIPA